MSIDIKLVLTNWPIVFFGLLMTDAYLFIPVPENTDLFRMIGYAIGFGIAGVAFGRAAPKHIGFRIGVICGLVAGCVIGYLSLNSADVRTLQEILLTNLLLSGVYSIFLSYFSPDRLFKT